MFSGPSAAPPLPPAERPGRRRLPLALFAATLITTHATGALMAGGEWYQLHKGISYGATLMLILLAHEMGHYLACRYHRIKATLPYFIPFFPLLGIGTLGAFIRIKEPFRDRKTMLDIGIAGPLAGFAVALPATIIGLALSGVARVSMSDGGMALGDSLLTRFLSWALHPGLGSWETIIIHPMGFAGYLGLLVTALNLMPIGQLDGGHILYALSPKFARIVAWAGFIALLVLGSIWPGALFWAFLLLIIGISHPAPRNLADGLSTGRRKLGLAALILFILTFVPIPFTFIEPQPEPPLPEDAILVQHRPDSGGLSPLDCCPPVF